MVRLFSLSNKGLLFTLASKNWNLATKDTSFIQHLALSMLPPFLPSIVDIRQIGYLKVGLNLRIYHKNHLMGLTNLDAWQGLVMNEGVVGQAIRRSVLDSIEEGIIVNSKWYDCESYEQVRNSLDMLLVPTKKELAAHILLACYNAGFEEDIGLIINTRGETSEENAFARNYRRR